MRDGAELNYEDLQEAAYRALEASDYTQQELARELGVARTSLARAVTQPGTRYQQLQMRIIDTLTDYEVEKNITFTTRCKKDPEGN